MKLATKRKMITNFRSAGIAIAWTAVPLMLLGAYQLISPIPNDGPITVLPWFSIKFSTLLKGMSVLSTLCAGVLAASEIKRDRKNQKFKYKNQDMFTRMERKLEPLLWYGRINQPYRHVIVLKQG